MKSEMSKADQSDTCLDIALGAGLNRIRLEKKEKGFEVSEKRAACPNCGGPIGKEAVAGVNACEYCGGGLYIGMARNASTPQERPVSLKMARKMHQGESFWLMTIYLKDIAEEVYGDKSGNKKARGPGALDFIEGMLAAFNRVGELDTGGGRDEAFWSEMARVPGSEDGTPRSERFRVGYLEGLSYVINLVDDGKEDEEDGIYYEITCFSRILAGAGSRY